MTEYFGVPEYQTNLTLILFFIFYAISTLVWGPFSDRYGRRPILLIGLTCYTVAGALCALSPNIYLLMLFRVVQAVGAAPPVPWRRPSSRTYIGAGGASRSSRSSSR